MHCLYVGRERIFHCVRCAGLGRPLHTYEQREQATKIAETEYFTWAGSDGLGRPLHTYEQREQALKWSFSVAFTSYRYCTDLNEKVELCIYR